MRTINPEVDAKETSYFGLVCRLQKEISGMHIDFFLKGRFIFRLGDVLERTLIV